ncbi:hypothetical protein SprV_0902654900 [Sparganum proliferum]
MLDAPCADSQVNPQVVKKRRLSPSSIASPATDPSGTDVKMVADARRRAFDAGITPTTDFERATEILVQLFDHPDAPGVANQRFATLRQHPTQSVDDFAGELMRLAAIAYPNLPESDRDCLILHRFITGLHDRRATDILLLEESVASERSFRSLVHSSTGFTPHYLWTGREIRLSADLQYHLHTPDPTTISTYASHLRETIRTAYNSARETIGASRSHQKTQHDRHSTGATHQVGDLVMHYNPVPPRGISAKLHYPWQGPFVILDVLSPSNYLLRDASQPQSPTFTANFNKLKPYRGRLPLCTSETLPILPDDQVPPVAIEVTVPSTVETTIASPVDHSSTEDSAAS